MFKLYKNLKWYDWLGIVGIILLTFLQVYITMSIVDYVQGIVKAITYVNYHNNPAEISSQLATLVESIGWDGIKAMAPQFGEMADTIIAVCDASTNDIIYNGLMMVGLAFGLMFVQAIISLVASFVAADLSTNIRDRVYKKIEGFSMAEINRFSTASLITRTTNDIQNVQMANLMMFRMIFAAPITAVWAILKIQATSTELTMATAVAIILLLICIISLMLIVIPKFKIMQQLTDALNGTTRENLTGIRIIRAFNAEKYHEEKFEEANTNFTNMQLFTGKVMALLSPIMMIIMNGISLAMYWIGANLINAGTTDYATVTAFMTLSSQIIMAFMMLMMMFVLWPRASVCAKRINEVLETSSSIIDTPNPIDFKQEGTIEFKNVSFKYPGSSDDVIKDINFTAKKGECVAIIGATGSGKTTLLNLIPRIYDTSSGEVLVDGVNVKDVKEEDLRSKIGYVTQKSYLFSGTIRDNISFSKTNLTDEEIMDAAKIACADGIIELKENKLDEVIAQGGANISGGQKQRFAIARAIAYDPEILLFDDSFSALDYKTDRQVRSNLNKYKADKTRIIVAQRIGTIMDADKIIVLDDGKIVGMGKHDELLRNCEVYKEIAMSQLSQDELNSKEVK